MRSFVTLLLSLLLAVSVSAGPVIPAMPIMPENDPDNAGVLRGCPSVVRMAYDTPETKDKDYYDSAFWSLSDEIRRPFVAVKFSARDEYQMWIDLDRDGTAEEYYGARKSYLGKYPNDNFCTDVLPRVK